MTAQNRAPRAVPRLVPFLPLMLLTLSSCGTHEPSAQEILAKYFNAVGGKEAIQAFKSRTEKGAFSLPDMGYSGEFASYIKPPNLALQQISLGGAVVASSGKINDLVWQTNPMTGPKILKGAEARSAIRAASLDPVLPWTVDLQSATVQDWSAESPTVEVLLRETDGDQAICEFDQKTGLLNTIITFAGDQRTMTSYSEYESADGVAVPRRIQTNPGGQTLVFVISEVEHNQDLPDSMFEPPADIVALMKNPDE